MGNSTRLDVGQKLLVSSPNTQAAKTTGNDTWEGSANASGQGDQGYYTVKSGDNLYDIAFKFNITQAELRSWNNLGNTSTINPGQRLIVNRTLAERTLGKLNDNAAGTTASQTTYHKVNQSETLYRIAQRYNVKVSDIQRWNNMNDAGIYPGQQLIVSEPGGSNTRMAASPNLPNVSRASSTNQGAYLNEGNANTGGNTAAETYHTVKKGDTLYSISRRYGVSVRQIKILNNKQDDSLNIGDKLRVK
jgi:LysM repeat protein